MPVLDLTGINREEMAKLPRPTNEQLRNLFTGVDPHTRPYIRYCLWATGIKAYV